MKFRNYRVNSNWMKFEERLGRWYLVQLEKPVILYVVLPNTGTSYLNSSWAFYQMQAKHQKLRSSGFSINTKSVSSSDWTTWVSIGVYLEQSIPNTLGYNSYSDSNFIFPAWINTDASLSLLNFWWLKRNIVKIH